ncbi:MAG: sigma 54-interacting transcriptional regulator [Myxococcota bacterium]
MVLPPPPGYNPGMPVSTPTPAEDLAAERDFLLCLVDFVESEAPTRLVEEALRLVAARASATRAYLEIGDPARTGGGWSSSLGFEASAIEDIRKLLSTTIIAETLKHGRTVETSSAATDPRFGGAESVRRNQIEAVLCVPVGAPPVGVIYLQGHSGGHRFPPEAKAWGERFASLLRPVASRLALKPTHDGADPTVPHRARLFGADALVGRSTALAAVLRMASSVAGLDVSILLTGPSGTGKSELARVIARSGSRRDGPFVALNCAAIPDELLESELFGAHAGAHSTATRKVPGKVELASGGTLFLDEIGELSPSAQAKLLQLLQDGTYWPLGAAKAMHADVRVIAATNANLTRRVAEGRFREDLFYRLNAVTIELPGLEARRTDVPLLAEHFLAEARERHGLVGLELSLAARHALMVAEWPGHVRHLANVVLGAAIRAHAEGSSVVDARHVFPDDRPRSGADKAAVPWQVAVRDVQRRMLQDALDSTQGNIPEAARRLGIARSYAYELVRELGIRV